MRVLIADDSIVFRSQIKLAIDGVSGIKVVGTASNGKIAVDKLDQEAIDLIVMDVEMPEMTGLEALRELRRRGHKTIVLMFSSHTKIGADTTLEALSAGAQDFVTKPSGDSTGLDHVAQSIRESLLPKMMQFLAKDMPGPVIQVARKNSGSKYAKYPVEKSLPSIVVIGSSTGGPAALEEVLRGLQGKVLRCPILIAQHMPPVFTASLASRIQTLTGIPCTEGKHMERVEKKIYIAPGDFHMSVGIVDGTHRILLDQEPPRNSVRPAVDSLFESSAKIYGNRCVGIVLTGMGSDGAIGSVAIKEKGGGVVIQNKETCVVFGMPSAVLETEAFDVMTDLSRIREIVIGMCT
jgi:two-component system chemotaxis response regulator CheB